MNRLSIFLTTWLLGTWLSACVSAQELDPNDPVFLHWYKQPQLKSCILCHLNGQNLSVSGGFVRQAEMALWVTQDKHAIARRRVEPLSEDQIRPELVKLDAYIKEAGAEYVASQNDGSGAELGLRSFPEEWLGQSNLLSLRICNKLWPDTPPDTDEGYALFRDNCLTCHGGYQEGKDTVENGYDLASKDQGKLGIDCLYCHQDDQNERSDWIANHAVQEASIRDYGQPWRLLTPETKSQAGMRHLVGTSNQASLCADCHVGNRSKGLFVTHEMYAAGHPPLPSMEVHTFCTKMPQHWQTPSQLHQSIAKSESRDEYFATNYPGVTGEGGDKVYWNTRKMLLGALVAREKTLSLIIDSATAHRWGDYSLYDCASCHHELRSNSFRQQRGFPAAPGRPRQHEWASTLVNIAHEFRGAKEAEAARLAETELAIVFGEKPFGNPEEVRAAATNVKTTIDKTIAAIEQKPVNAVIALKVLQRLTQTPSEEIVTYDSARQIVWAMQVIADELTANQFGIGDDVISAIKELGSQDVSGLTSRLPSGRKQFIYPDALERDLDQRAAFDPMKLRKRLIEIGKMLGVTQSARFRIAP